MKKIIPFKKNLEFKTNLSEITSISLDNTLEKKDYMIEGDLIISGNYKITDTSVNVDNFDFKIPINIEIDKKYEIENMIIDIDDFYYEIVNNNTLEINIDVLLDNITEKPIINQMENNDIELVQELRKKIDEISEEQKQDNTKIGTPSRCIEEESTPSIEVKNIIDNMTTETKVQNIIDNMTTETKVQNIVDNMKTETEVQNILGNITTETEQYSTYSIYIVREGDTIEQIINKYNTNKETLSSYNDLNEIKIGDKIIIPS